MASEATGGRGHFGTHDQVLGGAGPGHRLRRDRSWQDPGLLRERQPGRIRPGPSHGAGDLRCILGKPIYNRLTDFEPGTTKRAPGPRRKLGRLARRARIHLPSPQGGQVPDDRGFHADARFQRRRRRLHLRAPAQQGPSLFTATPAASGRISPACRCPSSSSRSSGSTTRRSSSR